ncbi:MAG: hypothetical protein U9N01_04340 [Euryarchaeota archaeon]|nr:hypothetical protein [Euryarchaeota archaeon]
MGEMEEELIKTEVGEAEGVDGIFLCCIDRPTIGNSDIELIGFQIREEELKPDERANLGTATTYGYRTRKEIKEYLEGGRICILDVDTEVSK